MRSSRGAAVAPARVYGVGTAQVGHREDGVLLPLLPFAHQYDLSMVLIAWLKRCSLVIALPAAGPRAADGEGVSSHGHRRHAVQLPQHAQPRLAEAESAPRAGAGSDRPGSRHRDGVRLARAGRCTPLQRGAARRPGRATAGRLPQGTSLRPGRARAVHPRRQRRGPGIPGRPDGGHADLLRRRVPRPYGPTRSRARICCWSPRA